MDDDLKMKIAEALKAVSSLEGVVSVRNENDEIGWMGGYLDRYLLVGYFGGLLERGMMEIKIDPDRLDYVKKLLEVG